MPDEIAGRGRAGAYNAEGCTAVVVFDDARAEVKDLTSATTGAGFPSALKR